MEAPTRPARSLFPPVLLFLLTCLPASAFAAPVLGFVEEFTAAGTGGWEGGVFLYTNPGTGGVLGDGDGFLYVQTVSEANWGVRCRFCPEYSGNWNAAGITQIRLWLNDVGPPEPFEIHVTVGNDGNLWQYNVGFEPPSGAWSQFVVDLTSPGDFTQIAGSGSLAAALDNVSVVLIRHDKAPFLPIPNPPDPIAGDAGIDRILLTNGLVGVEGPGPPGARSLRLAAPYPNPARGAVTFGIETPDGGPVRIEIVDLMGRVVRRALLPGGASRLSWRWDGLDGNGRRLMPGTYRLRASGAAGGASRSFVLLD